MKSMTDNPDSEVWISDTESGRELLLKALLELERMQVELLRELRTGK
jgi:hypothetical protein